MPGNQLIQVQGALPLSYANDRFCNRRLTAGFEPATSRVEGEVTRICATGKSNRQSKSFSASKARPYAVPDQSLGWSQPEALPGWTWFATNKCVSLVEPPFAHFSCRGTSNSGTCSAIELRKSQTAIHDWRQDSNLHSPKRSNPNHHHRQIHRDAAWASRFEHSYVGH